MAGSPQTADKLNHTLHYLLDFFDEHNIDDWFISYGTLLGITREGSCIDGDDDIDICINNYWPDVKKLLQLDNIWHYHPNFINTHGTEELAQMDFYLCDVNDNGDFKDTWERVTWSQCYEDDGCLAIGLFQGRELNIPANHIKKLETRYGPTWKQRVERGSQAGDGYRNQPIL